MARVFRIVSFCFVFLMVLSITGTPVKGVTFTGCVEDNGAGVTVAECEALVELYNHTSGSSWTNKTGWLASTDISTWYGVVVNVGHVTFIQLSSNNLGGTIPNTIGSLSYVKDLELQSNSISGGIPSEISGMIALETLNLSNNQLTGEIPSTIFALPSLQYLYITNNQLSGSIPSGALNSPSLLTVQLYVNQLTGSLPEVTSVNNKLLEFNAYGNQISGSIPTSIGNLKALIGFFLSENQLTGSIPVEVGQMSTLWYFYVGNNKLSGTIPPELFTPTVREIQLIHNKLTGPIPSEISNAVELRKFFAGYNFLSGPIPASIGSLTYLQRVWIEWNDLYGEVPAGILDLTDTLYSSAGFLTGANGLWTMNSTLETYLNSQESDWASFQGSQGLLPAEGDYVGWGDLNDDEAFLPIFQFSKQFNSAGVAAPAYFIEVKEVSTGDWLLQIEVDGTDTSICPASTATDPPVICEYRPQLSDFTRAPVPGEHYWKISNAFEKDIEDNWMWINVDGAKNFTIAQTPMATYPTNQTTKVNPTLKWGAVDGAEAYGILIKDNTWVTMSEFDVAPTFCSGDVCSYTPSTSVLNLPDGSYTWLLRANMGGTDYTDWSSVTFTRVSPPTTKQPAVANTMPNPKFIWTPVAGQTRYQIQLYTSAGVKKLDKTFDTSVCSATTCTYAPTTAILNLANGAYKWKVRAGDEVELGSYSAFKTFNKVSPPAGVSPTGTITATNPTFKWKKITGVTKYYLELRKSSGTLVKAVTIISPTCTSTTCSYTFAPALNLAKGDYKWHVKAYHGYYGPYGAYMVFKKQ